MFTANTFVCIAKCFTCFEGLQGQILLFVKPAVKTLFT